MFQTEPVHFLQSLGNDWITALMVSVSALGYAPFYIGVMSLILFGMSFRKGSLLLQMVLWVAVATELLKNEIALPRPSDVDVNVLLPGKDYPNRSPLSDMGGRGFFALPQPEAIRLYRAQPEWSYGFPSGHVSTATTFWGGLSLLYPNVQVRLLSAVVIVLMPLSRMYLGRHFLADVLGGLLLGGLVVTTAWATFCKAGTTARLLQSTRLALTRNARAVTVTALLIGLPLLLLLSGSRVGPDNLGRLFGVNAAFVLIARRGYPDDAGSVLKRSARVALAPAIYIVAKLGTGRLEAIPAVNDDLPLVDFLSEAAPTFLLLWGTVASSFAVGLYHRRLG